MGIIGGLGSWVFRLAINLIYEAFFFLPMQILNSLGLSTIIWVPFLLTPIIGGLIVGYLTSKVSKETKGHGVPEVLESVALNNGKMNLRIPFIKIIASATTIGSGGSAGREGPIAQIGAGFASLIGQKLNLSSKELRTLVVSGVAAGIAATFNAPIGGSLFALEVLMGEGGTTGLLIPIIVAAVVGVVVGQLLLGTDPAFIGFPALEYHEPYLIPLFVILGLVCGAGSAFWIKFFYKLEDIFDNIFEKFKIPGILQPAFGGVFVGLTLVITYFFVGEQWETVTIMGRSYLPMDAVFQGSLLQGSVLLVLLTLILLFVLKALNTVFTIGTGGSGGVFAPTLFLGVMLGAIFGIIVDDIIIITNVPIPLLALLGMAAFFAGTGRAPLTAVIMTAEMTKDYFLTIPLMIVVSISWIVSILLEKDNIYTLKLIRRGVVLKEPTADILETITVIEAMTPRDKLVVVDTKTRLETVMELVRTTRHEGFPVVEQDMFIGVITLSDVQKAMHSSPKDWNVFDVLITKKRPLICIHKEATLMHAVHIMESKDISRLPVVEKFPSQKNEFPKLIGWITHHDITRVYISEKALSTLQASEEHIFSYQNGPSENKSS
ncbi:MAG: chloride channel protein [Candidatus Heimdallarchaeota archaeon]|nr:MAG: chloride channel protein [Candidatus Heimdallarchaeota archaeon]